MKQTLFLEEHKKLENGTTVYKINFGGFLETKKNIQTLSKCPVLKNDLYPNTKNTKVIISYLDADDIYDSTNSLCKKIHESLPMCDIVNPLRDTGKVFVLKIYGTEALAKTSTIDGKILPRTVCVHEGKATVQFYLL